MGWKVGYHNDGDCFLPTFQEIVKQKWQDGSICGCITGCDRIYRVDLRLGRWIEVERIKVQDRPVMYDYKDISLELPIEGFNTTQEHAPLFVVHEIDEAANAARREEQRQLKAIENSIDQKMRLATAQYRDSLNWVQRMWFDWNNRYESED